MGVPLKLCPFCGSDGITGWQRKDDDLFVKICLDCGAEGPYRGTERKAARAWNTRRNELPKWRQRILGRIA